MPNGKFPAAMTPEMMAIVRAHFLRFSNPYPAISDGAVMRPPITNMNIAMKKKKNAGAIGYVAEGADTAGVKVVPVQ